MEWHREHQEEERKKSDHEALQAGVGEAFDNISFAALKLGQKSL